MKIDDTVPSISLFVSCYFFLLSVCVVGMKRAFTSDIDDGAL